jgi:hypothetical protein
MGKRIHTSSRVGSMVCLACGVGELRHDEIGIVRCGGREGALDGGMLEALVQIAALPEALGSRPCECGHPEMGLLPEGTVHCPSCGSEVPPAGSSAAPCVTTEAYLCSWEDGLFGEARSFARNENLPKFGAPHERLDYYRGHRAGRETRF